MESDNLRIVKLCELLKLNLSIPSYQRPYRWTTESASILFNDIYSAFKNSINEYRIGSVVLHKNNKDNNEVEYDIVDGQQRVTTLTILAYCFYQVSKEDDNKKQNYLKLSNLLERKNTFDELSSKAIIENYEVLKKHCEIIGNELPNFIQYVLENCTFVKIVTNSEQEAFQFFDSQNSRGKALAPQDLLKSYHLREMSNSNEDEKIEIINAWENEDQKDLAKFFEYNLYPLVQWYKNKDGLYYSVKKIKTFRGIKQNSNYHYSIYHKAANLYIEHFNLERMYELMSGEKINQFQLTQPLIAGKRFFKYTLYYFHLYEEVIRNIKSKFSEYKVKYNAELIPTNGTGDSYVRTLFINIVIFFIDKFNMEELTDSRLKFLYKWAYSLRIVMHSVYPQTINRYALGKSDRINNGLNLFAKIAEMQSPNEIDSIVLKKVELESCKSTKYQNIWNILFGGNK